MVMPSMVPPVIATLLAFCVAMVPRPRFDLAVAAFVRSERLDGLGELLREAVGDGGGEVAVVAKRRRQLVERVEGAGRAVDDAP